MSLVSRQIEQALFDAALHLPDAEARSAFLDQTCRDQPALRQRLEKLLAAATAAEDFFEIDPLRPSEDFQTEPPPLKDSDVRIGRYRLLLRIGEGGCGVVYCAEQDGPVTRRVALKIIRLGMDTERVIARFELERQALGMMDHPNIARVLDAGATANGRPFFVMELVSGVRITEFCQAHSLSTSERLELFIQVCSAIQHAHQKGILHRDIKPSNVLVTDQDGRPVSKVIDFGIAKAVEGRLSGDTSVTAFDQFIGTPAYMSPEQLGVGPDIDTRSDIYSLGALLYELLTGRPPFDTAPLLESGLEKMRQTLLEEDPPLPSQVLEALDREAQAALARQHRSEPAHLIALLQGDLDWIVMKAMEKDRARRYPTVNGLASDLERYLRHEPVNARPPSRRYRLGKFIRRNRTVLAAGSAVMLALAAGIGVSSHLFLREREARRAEAQLREEAEDRERIARAAVLVNQHHLEEADRLLDEVHHYPSSPSLDGIAAFRWVAEWLALRRQHQKAASRFYTLLQVNDYDDQEVVAMDYISCGALLAVVDDKAGFERFRKLMLEKLPAETNASTLGRYLRAGLLDAPDPSSLSRFQALATKAEESIPQSGDSAPWLNMTVGLWKYRLGQYPESLAWCRQVVDGAQASPIQKVTARIVRAMALARLGQHRESADQLATCHKILQAHLAEPPTPGNFQLGYWFDWVFAQALYQEAEALISASALRKKG